MMKRLLFVSLLCLPVVAWALYKPMRIITPEWVAGISCVSDVICLDDVSRFQEAAALYDSAFHFVETQVGTMGSRPRVVFCTSQACFESFGFSRAAAHAVGVSGIVVGPRGWEEYFLRHEMIHHLQAERLGVYEQWRGPDWYIEGMAYSLSEDPRLDLADPWGKYRSQFDQWYRKVGREALWSEGGNTKAVLQLQ
jgi:hypothetical protein